MNAATKSPKTATTKPAYKHTLTTPTERSIVVEREFDAPKERVWRAHSDPKLLAQWWGRGNKLDVVTYEFEKGGHWRFVEHSEGGQHGFEGRFREITPMDRISMTFEWDGMPGWPVINQLELHDVGGGRTKVVATSLFYSAEERDGMLSYGMEGGMNESYEALDRLLASL